VAFPCADNSVDHDPIVTVVIVNFQSWPDTERLVESLLGTPEVETGLVQVVVVDNASEGSPPLSLETSRPGLQLILRNENGGFAVGVNTGWRASRTSWLLLLNPDVSVPEGFLNRVVSLARRYETDHGSPGVVGFALRNPDGTRQPSVGKFPTLLRSAWEQLIPRSRRKYQAVWRTKPGTVDWVTGACVLVSARMLEGLGGLDEDFFLYYEEVALCRSASRGGWRVEFDPSIEVVHLRPLQNRPVSARMRVITRHSKLLYFRKHLPRWEFLGLCLVVAAEARWGAVWSRVRGRKDEARAWRTVAEIERTLRQGGGLGGRDIRLLADQVDPAHRAEDHAQAQARASEIEPEPAGTQLGP
jgi:N-acetylglucosaminyl-diphospho-decaprenol L-rhamnosyltransferase